MVKSQVLIKPLRLEPRKVSEWLFSYVLMIVISVEDKKYVIPCLEKSAIILEKASESTFILEKVLLPKRATRETSERLFNGEELGKVTNAAQRSERRLADGMPNAWSCWLCPIGLNRDGLPLVPYRQA